MLDAIAIDTQPSQPTCTEESCPLPSVSETLAAIRSRLDFRLLRAENVPLVDQPAAWIARCVPLPDSRMRPLAGRLAPHLAKYDLQLPRVVMVPGDLNALAMSSRLDGRWLFGICAGALHCLTDDELAFMVGHEAGHMVASSDAALEAVLRRTASLQPPHPLVHLRFSLLRRIELECDRRGLCFCKNLKSATSTLIKAATGGHLGSVDTNCTQPFFDPSVDGWAPHLETHPTVAIRARALELFAQKGSSANEEIESLLDRMELDSNKRDQSAVRMLYSAVAAIGRAHLTSLGATRSRAHSLLEAMAKERQATAEISEEGSVAWLLQNATRGRRVWVLRFLSSLSLAVGSDEQHVLQAWRVRLQLPMQLSEALQRSGRSITAALNT